MNALNRMEFLGNDCDIEEIVAHASSRAGVVARRR
jgi:hypothetical protein